MPNDMSTNSTATTPDNSVEVRFGKKHRVRVGSLSERVQMQIVLSVTALGFAALGVAAYAIKLKTQVEDEAAPVS